MISFENGSYRSREDIKVSALGRLFPSVVFYIHWLIIVIKASIKARKGRYDGKSWSLSSYNVLQQLEAIGLKVDVRGVENLRRVDGPVVVVSNHMSMMETMILPAIIQPEKPVTFVLKESLLRYPVFKHILFSIRPVAVTRTNPREDLKTILTEGVERLHNDVSLIVFPQTTRDQHFDPKQMSSIGVKLAKKGGATLLPLAVKTDCWENGIRLKDFGRINVEKTAYFSFGEPLRVKGKGDGEQQVINDFITAELKKWRQ